MKRIFVTKRFDKDVKKQQVTDADLYEFINEIDSWDNLGAGLYKARFAIHSNSGKRGGARMILSVKVGEKYFYLHAYTKTNKDTLSVQDEKRFKIISKLLLRFDEKQLTIALNAGELREVIYG